MYQFTFAPAVGDNSAFIFYIVTNIGYLKFFKKLTFSASSLCIQSSGIY